MSLIPSFPLNATLGASFLGNIGASILYGISCIQTFIYYKRSGGDTIVLKSLILLLWILDTIHLAFVTHAVYSYAILDFGDYLSISKPLWCITSHVTISSLSDLIVRGLYCHRIWKLSQRNLWMTIAVASISLLSFASGFAFSIWGFQHPNYFLADAEQLSVFLYLNFVSGVVADSLIAVLLCVLLMRQRTGYSRTNTLLYTLLIYTVNTGVLSSCCALLCLLLYASLPGYDRLSFVAVYFVLPKLLLNSLLATLNARRKLMEKTSRFSVSLDRLAIPSRNIATRHSRVSMNSPVLEIKIETSTEVDSTSSIPTLSPRL